MEFDLPEIVRELVATRDRLRAHYQSANLRFTIDGNLLGDIGEAVAAELYGVRLTERNGAGIDAIASDNRTVQIKASGCGRGPAFRMTDTRADHLLFFHLDLERCKGVVVFNGPEDIAIRRLPSIWTGQRSLTAGQIRAADKEVLEGQRLTALAQG